MGLVAAIVVALAVLGVAWAASSRRPRLGNSPDLVDLEPAGRSPGNLHMDAEPAAVDLDLADSLGAWAGTSEEPRTTGAWTERHSEPAASRPDGWHEQTDADTNGGPGGVRAPTTEHFRQALRRKFALATAAGRQELLVTAGDLHKEVQPGPYALNRMPAVCNAMNQEKQDGDVVEYAPPKGRGPRLAIRYRLPRPDGTARPRPTAPTSTTPSEAVAPPRAQVVATPTSPTAPAPEHAPLLVVLSCTKKKAVTHPHALTWDDFGEPAQRARREAELMAWAHPARDMYCASPAFCTAIRAVDDIRRHFGASFVEVRIVSAGYGLIEERTPIVPYDATFATQSAPEVASRARLLGIPNAVRAAADAHPVTVFLLGKSYLAAADLPGADAPSGRRIYLTAGGVALPTPRGATLVRLGRRDMERLGAGQVTLKARALAAFSRGLGRLGSGYLADLVGDDTDKSFRHAMEVGE